MKNVSIILTTRNTLPYTKQSYGSIRKYYPTVEIVMLDDDSKDGTIEWMDSLTDENLIKWKNPTGKQLGHTITYNIGAKLSTKPIICIFHSDMVCTQNFLTNILKHIKPKTIVSGTRIEPPVYPSDDAKIIQNFGIYIEDFKGKEFLTFVEKKEKEFKDKTTNGFFAPWTMYRDEYIEIGGMDKLFAPYPTEDSDFINRLFLAGYNIIQSRDSFCYHWASRAHRWTTGRVNIDTEEFTKHQQNSIGNFLRKWGSYPKNNSLSYPLVNKKYDIGLEVNCDINQQLDHILPCIETSASTIYIDLNQNYIDDYIKNVQPETFFNLKNKIKNINEQKNNDIIVKFKWSDFIGDDFSAKNTLKQNQQNLHGMTRKLLDNILFLSNLSDIISNSGEIGIMEYDIFNIEIKRLNTYENKLIYLNDEYYTRQLNPDYLSS